MTSLWNNTNYTSLYPYAFNTYITEYDISKANINVLFYLKAIDQKTYDTLLVADRYYRERYVGIMELKDPTLYEKLKNGITEFRKRFCEANELEDADILSIRNDAIYVIGKKCKYKKFDNIVFNDKNRYTTFVRLGKLEVFYNYDRFGNNEVVDVKGISDKILPIHQQYMISFLCDIFYRVQTSTIEDAIKTYTDFYEAYVGRKLDKGYYREFNSDSMYRLDSAVSSYYMPDISQDMVSFVNLDVNISLLRDLHGILSDAYFSRVRKG